MRFISAALALLSAVLAVEAVPANLTERQSLAQVITRCTKPNTVALTFDDGPYVYLYDISKALVAAGAKGTFFFNGNNYGCIYSADNVKRVKYAYSKGHQVASHTWSHADLTKLSWDRNHNEFWRMEQALMRIVGVKPAFIRPPYGKYNNLVRQVAAVRGQKLVTWDFDCGDSVGVSPSQSKQRYTNIANAHPSTLLALNHEVYERTAHDVVPHAISVLKAKGYRLVTVAECLGLPAYQSVGSPSSGSFSC
jgi:peptidoglycan/xylan/chitin deacetylase (PgdA/CDA1 family)